MTGSAPATGRSSTGAQSTVMPSAARSSAISRAPRKAASAGFFDAAMTAAGGYSRQCGGFSRATRPPSWSISTGASARRTVSRKPITRFLNCAGLSTLRWNRMKPSGSALRKNFFSLSVNRLPLKPKMTARGSRLDEDAGDMALFEGVAALRGRGFVGNRPGHDAVVDAALGPEIDLDRIGGQSSQNVGLRRFEPGPAGLRRFDRAQRAQLQEIPLARRQSRR